MKILVTGGAAQINPEKWSSMSEVNFVIGNKEKLDDKFWGSFNVDVNHENNNKIFVQYESCSDHKS